MIVFIATFLAVPPVQWPLVPNFVWPCLCWPFCGLYQPSPVAPWPQHRPRTRCRMPWGRVWPWWPVVFCVVRLVGRSWFCPPIYLIICRTPFAFFAGGWRNGNPANNPRRTNSDNDIPSPAASRFKIVCTGSGTCTPITFGGCFGSYIRGRPPLFFSDCIK